MLVFIFLSLVIGGTSDPLCNPLLDTSTDIVYDTCCSKYKEMNEDQFRRYIECIRLDFYNAYSNCTNQPDRKNIPVKEMVEVFCGSDVSDRTVARKSRAMMCCIVSEEVRLLGQDYLDLPLVLVCVEKVMS